MVALAAAIVFAASLAPGRVLYPLFQFRLMGWPGRFSPPICSTCFVIFEIMLAASVRPAAARLRSLARLRACTIAINHRGVFAVLVGASMLYGITGTLNMADLARAIRWWQPGDHWPVHAAWPICVAFLIKGPVGCSIFGWCPPTAPPRPL